MDKKSPLSAFLAAILIGGLFLASAMRFGTVQAFTGVSGIPKPSVPQFSIQVVDHSYDVPTTYSTDSYTGQPITHPGYHVEDIRVEGKIKNQHFTPFTMPNPKSTDGYKTIDFYYNVRYKGHFGDESEWMTLYGTRYVEFLKQNYGSEYTNFTVGGYDARVFQDGAVIDFQVKAHVGFETWGFVGTWPYRILNGEDSGWSNTLTVTISKDATSSNTYATNIDSSPYPTLTSPDKNSSTTTPEASSSSSSTQDKTADTSVPDASPSQNSTAPPTQQNPMQPEDQTLSFNWTEIAIFTVVGVVVALLIIIIAFLRKRVQTLERKIGNSGG